MIDAEFVQKIVDLAPTIKFDLTDPILGSRDFTSSPVFEVKAEAPKQADTIVVHTLAGFGTLIETGVDVWKMADCFIKVFSESEVSLWPQEADAWGRRAKIISATPVPFEGFKFGAWMSQEDFVIAVAAKFAQTDDKSYVLSVASSLTTAATSVSEDDGFTQRATVKAGMKTAEDIKLKGIVELAPFRTFPEVGQPISSFVFRAKQTPSGPTLMLVEADGGKWKIDAIKEVQSALKGMALEPTIVA